MLQGTRTCRVSSASATGTIWSPASRRWPHLVLRPRAKRSLKHEEDKAPAARPPRSPAARPPGFHHMWPFPEERIPRSGPRNRDGAVRFAGSFSIIRTQRSLPSPGRALALPRKPPATHPAVPRSQHAEVRPPKAREERVCDTAQHSAGARPAPARGALPPGWCPPGVSSSSSPGARGSRGLRPVSTPAAAAAGRCLALGERMGG